ncbi:MAG: sigma-70 family RNA polymerase sigma factor [Treponema sp.]|nr:sigma-70 family RNA polymerase sigma factor [Treponema sp.]
MDKDTIYRQYHDKVLHYIIGKNINLFEADDVCQTVFIKIFNNIDRFDETKASISTWVYTITQNAVIDYFRSKGRSKEGGGIVSEDIVYVDTSFDHILNQETLSELSLALEKLSERDRNLIIYMYYDGMTMKAAAEKLGISYANAKIIIKKSFATLRKHLS